jgi:hypothetical protein
MTCTADYTGALSMPHVAIVVRISRPCVMSPERCVVLQELCTQGFTCRFVSRLLLQVRTSNKKKVP